MSALNIQLKAKIIHTVLDSNLFGDDCDIFSFEREDGVKRYQGESAYKFSPEMNVIFSIPTDCRNIYITVSDGDNHIIRKVLATLEDIESESSLKLGNVQLFNSPELISRNICGVILLPINTSNILDFLPEHIICDQDDYRFLLVVFISEKEHLIWKQNGHDALMEYFSAIDKDLISFGDQ